MKLAIQGEDKLVYVTDVAEDLRDQAEILLRQIASKGPVKNGDVLRVRVDWGIVKLERHGNEILVSEPDYGNDPRNIISGINFTCAVLRAQQDVHDRLNVSAEPVSYDQSLLVYPKALSAVRVAAVRQKSASEGDCGWRLFDARKIDWSPQPQARRVYELARERSALMSILSLPVDWSVKLKDDILEEAAAPGGEAMAIGLNIAICRP